MNASASREVKRRERMRHDTTRLNSISITISEDAAGPVGAGRPLLERAARRRDQEHEVRAAHGELRAAAARPGAVQSVDRRRQVHHRAARLRIRRQVAFSLCLLYYSDLI